MIIITTRLIEYKKKKKTKKKKKRRMMMFKIENINFMINFVFYSSSFHLFYFHFISYMFNMCMCAFYI